MIHTHTVLAKAGGHWTLAIFPLIAGIIALVFALQLTRRYVVRRRPFEGVWVVALFMYAVASLAMFVGVVAGWTSAEFRIYYLLGGVLNVPYLLAGEVYLLAGRRAAGHALLLVLVAASAFAAWVIATATIHPTFLQDSLPLGREVFGSGSTPHRLAQYYSLPAYFLLLGGLVWSGAQMRGRPDLRHRVAGTLWIAVGATIVAIGSGIGAAFHVVPLFSVSLAAGIGAMYWGFLEAGRSASPARPDA